MRLIDADALKMAFEEDGHLSGYIEEYINDAPTIDAVPVVHAKWGKPIEYGLPYAANHLGVVCSCCCKWSDNKYNFCPNCGAKMDGGATCG